MTHPSADPAGNLRKAAPLERPAPLRHAVYDVLIEMIITRELQPGAHLVEHELAAQLGVSRQPVREALQRMQSEGWVDLRPTHRRRSRSASRCADPALADDDQEGLVAANAALHAAFVAMSGNTVLADLIGSVDRRVRWYYLPIALARGKDAWDEHAELIQAIGRQSSKRAGDLMRQHTERTREIYREQRQEAAEGRA
jgi:DNA-binding GntR family transcriptional regulator